MNLGRALIEVEEVLMYLAEDEKKRIPKEIFEFINKNKDREYTWEIDKSKKLQEQDLSEDALAILAYINMKYLLNEEQKELMEQFYELYDRKSDK